MPAAIATSPLDTYPSKGNPISVYADEFKGQVTATFPGACGPTAHSYSKIISSSRNNPHPRSFYSLQTINGSFIPSCVETPKTMQYLAYMRKKPENKLERRIKRAIKDFLHDKNDEDEDDLEIYPEPGYTNPQNIKPRLTKRVKASNNLSKPAGMKYFTYPEVYDNQVWETLRDKTPSDQKPWLSSADNALMERPPSRPQSKAQKCLDELYTNGDTPRPGSRPASQASGLGREKYYDARLKMFVDTDEGQAVQRSPPTPVVGLQRSKTSYPGLVSFEKNEPSGTQQAVRATTPGGRATTPGGRATIPGPRVTQSADMTMKMLDKYQKLQQPNPYTMSKRYPYRNTLLMSGILPADFRCDASMFQNSCLVAPRHYSISPEWISEKYSVNKIGNRYVSSNKLKYGMVHA